jgi:5-methylcytosine-specific restriction protein A
MPSAPLRYCADCGKRTSGNRCDVHQKAKRKIESRHYSAPDVNYGSRWKAARLEHLAEHPFCVACEALGRRTLANEVDHHIPHCGDATRFWDRSNWQSLCRPCHSAKTRREQAAGVLSG